MKRLPDEWLALKHPGLRIMDPDGWRVDDKSYDEPITEEDFSKRLVYCTVIGVF